MFIYKNWEAPFLYFWPNRLVNIALIFWLNEFFKSMTVDLFALLTHGITSWLVLDLSLATFLDTLLHFTKILIIKF
jgi:hypothetical protein